MPTAEKPAFKYDARDNLIQVTDPEGRVTQYTYTLRDQLASEVKQSELGLKSRSYQYDVRGNLIAEINSAQEKVTYSYDDANHFIKSQLYAHQSDESPIKVVNYLYNLKGQYTGYQQMSGTASSGQTQDIVALSETNSYNTLNQLIEVTVNYGSFQKTYRYSYYPNGLKKTYTNPEGITYRYHYNKNNQLEAVVIPSVGSLAYSDFDWLRPQTLTLPGGTKVRTQYDPFQRQQQRTLYDAADNELAKTIYAYDAESNITSIQTEHGDYRFDYDKRYRLEGTNYSGNNSAIPKKETFAYDLVGNRIRQESIAVGSDVATIVALNYGDQNQLMVRDNDWHYGYDQNGHTIRKEYSGADSESNLPNITDYIYNREERLIEVRHDGITIAQYAYDPYGRRVSKTVSGVTTYYLYSDQGLAAEYSATGALIKEYQYKQGGGGTTPLFQRTADGEYYYYQNDHLGTPQRLLAASGVVVWEARYEAFGRAAILTETVENNLRFPGQYFDEETRLHQNYFRDYDPESGRYLQSDPIGLRGGLNTFEYVNGNPIGRFDFYGLTGWTGTFTSSAVSAPFDGLLVEFWLTSDCVDGKRAKIHLYALAPILGFGIKGDRGSASEGWVTFEDYETEWVTWAPEQGVKYYSPYIRDVIDPLLFVGRFLTAGFGAEGGYKNTIGKSFSFFWFENVFIKEMKMKSGKEIGALFGPYGHTWLADDPIFEEKPCTCNEYDPYLEDS